MLSIHVLGNRVWSGWRPVHLHHARSDIFYTKVSTRDTNGDLYVFESSRVKRGGPALHFDYSQDECRSVLEGGFLIKEGDKLYNAKAGDTVFGPRGVPHAFTKTNNGNARMLMTFQSAGKMEEFFIAVGAGELAKMTLAEVHSCACYPAHGHATVRLRGEA